MSASKDDVLSRLTDPSKYTGSHAHRFDESGKGRGLAGRADLVNYTGSTNPKAITKTPPGGDDSSSSSSSASGSPRKPVVQGKLGAQKFGTQAEKAAVVHLYRNGDKNDSGTQLTINKGYKTLEQVLDKASQLVRLPTGAVRKIYKKGGKVSVKALTDFVDGGHYLCCGGEKPELAERCPKGFAEAQL